MPIEIPTLKRIDPQSPQSVGRIEARTPSGIADANKNFDAVEGLAKEAIKYQNQVADQTADNTATDRENRFESWVNTRMNGDPEQGIVGLKYQDGNPTELYQKFDQEAQDKLKEFSSAPDGQAWDTETQNLVNRRLGAKAQQLQNQTLTEYGRQQNKYDDTISHSGVVINQRAMPEATAHIVPGDDSSFDAFRSRINAIKDLRIRQAIRYGSARDNANGEDSYTAADGSVRRVTLDDNVKVQLGKDLSDGYTAALQNLITTDGALDKAQALKEKFGYLLDPLKKDAIGKQMKDTRIKDEAFAAADTARRTGKDLTQMNLEPEVMHKALEIQNSDAQHAQALKDRKSKVNANRLLSHLIDVQNSANPYLSKTDLENDKTFKDTFPNIADAKEKAAVYHMIEKPKESSPAALNRMQSLITGQDPEHDLTKMTPSEFQVFKTGLSTSDQHKYDRVYESAHTQNGAQIMRQYSYADKQLASEMVGAGLVKRNNFGKFEGVYDALFQKYRGELQDYMDTANHQMSPPEMRQHVQEFVAGKLKDEAFRPPPIDQKFNGGGRQAAPANKTPSLLVAPQGGAPSLPVAPPSVPPSSNAWYDKMSDTSKQDLIMQWRKANGNVKAIPNAQQLSDFIKTRGNK